MKTPYHSELSKVLSNAQYTKKILPCVRADPASFINILKTCGTIKVCFPQYILIFCLGFIYLFLQIKKILSNKVEICFY